MRLTLLLVAVIACSSVVSPMRYTHGVPNLDRVHDNVWRSGQITTQEGWDWIKHLAGSRRVHVVKLNYANEGSDALAKAMGFDVVELGVQPEGDQDLWDDFASVFKGPDPAQINQAEAVLALCDAHPDTDFCLGHCTHGQDRTGYLFGRHRVRGDRWTKAAAYTEMQAHGFHPELHGVHEAWESFVP